MKAIKYFILATLIFAVSKKIHVQEESLQIPFQLTSCNVVGTYEPTQQTATIQFTNVVQYNRATTPPQAPLKAFGTIPTPGYSPGQDGRLGGLRPITTLYGILQQLENSDLSSPTTASLSNATISSSQVKTYDKNSKTVTLTTGETYVGVIEYSQSVTPPSVENPEMVAFAEIKNQNYNPARSNLAGAAHEMTTLYGIQVQGTKVAIKKDKKEIGFYWPTSKIAQLNKGKTFVAIKSQKEEHYTQMHGIGPVWTWYTNADVEKYGISISAPDFQLKVQTIGSIKKQNTKEKFTLYGVLI